MSNALTTPVASQVAAERGILFSGEMVTMILTCAQCGHVSVPFPCERCGSVEFRKTHSRRVIKCPPCECGEWIPQEMSATSPEGWQVAGHSGRWWCGCCTSKEMRCPYGVPGSRLWVRETWAQHPALPGVALYRADDPKWADGETAVEQWRPSIFMPRWASRINLRLSSVKVERVQSISNEDAMREGCAATSDWRAFGVVSFRSRWNAINAKRGFGWDANPWVWVLCFQRE